MVKRLVNIPEKLSFFLFGGRGTGKSSWLLHNFSHNATLWLDLLKEEDEGRLRVEPDRLIQLCEPLKEGSLVVIDEIQKIPKLLDNVHFLMERKKLRFALTGSSARKLKRQGANLLAGRAVECRLYPFTYNELGRSFDLNSCLNFGSLPLIQSLSPQEKQLVLKTYTSTYLKEEILIEQLVRNVDPFRKFLAIAAQSDGKILNYNKMATDTGVDNKTVQTYYQILEETFVGYLLPSFHRSLRKRQYQNPKFYFFDIGISRALSRTLDLLVEPRSFEFGNRFEQFFVQQCIALNSYWGRDYELSYLNTKDGLEVDLILDKPGRKTIFLEIKSTLEPTHLELRGFKKLAEDFPDGIYYVVSRCQQRMKVGHINFVHWQDFLENEF